MTVNASSSDQVCSICYGENYRMPVEVCPNGHIFDLECLCTWFKKSQDAELHCPLCREVIDLSDIKYRDDILEKQGDFGFVEKIRLFKNPLRV